jgi:enoyl-CoA hydratase/carnithine racemase
MDPTNSHGGVAHEILDDHIMVITVDRKEKRNGFTPKMLAELAEAMTELDENPGLWVGVLTFAGDHTTAGLDMPLFFGADADPAALATKGLVDPLGLRRRLTKPQITAVQGITFTIGIELALAGDIIIAADDTRFSQLEPKRGLMAVGGATLRFVSRGGWGNAMYHLLRADEFTAQEAYRIGLVQEVVPAGQQRERAITLAREIAANAPLAVQLTKENAKVSLEEGEESAIAQFREINRRVNASDDLQEGIQSFIERRPARFTGH